MLTVEVKLNGKLVAEATIINTSALEPNSDYRVVWAETRCDELRIGEGVGNFEIKRHRRAQTVWALLGKAIVGILDQMTKDKA